MHNRDSINFHNLNQGHTTKLKKHLNLLTLNVNANFKLKANYCVTHGIISKKQQANEKYEG